MVEDADAYERDARAVDESVTRVRDLILGADIPSSGSGDLE